MKSLVQWKEKTPRKPLILQGARQVGKTWLLKEFGRTHFEETAYFNFDEFPSLAKIFTDSLQPLELIEKLSAFRGKHIDPLKTLIIFDEVQESPRTLTSLKYFSEELPTCPVVCAGSLLGITTQPGSSFPVGKVEFLNIYPLTFDEYLDAVGEAEMLSYLHHHPTSSAEEFNDKLISHLKNYFVIGGMPGVLVRWFSTKDTEIVSTTQFEIMRSYEADFSKHTPSKDIPHLMQIWNGLPGQLAHENKKFMYSQLKKNSRASEFENALHWLEAAGLVYKVTLVTKCGLPLSAYEESKSFKLFNLDTGLLRLKSGLSSSAIVEGNRLFTEFKGSLTENFVVSQLMAQNYYPLHYWTSGAQAEVDILLPYGSDIFPFEIKSGKTTYSPSLRVFNEKYSPRIQLRTSLLGMKKQTNLINIPLYRLFNLKDAIRNFADH